MLPRAQVVSFRKNGQQWVHVPCYEAPSDEVEELYERRAQTVKTSRMARPLYHIEMANRGLLQ